MNLHNTLLLFLMLFITVQSQGGIINVRTFGAKGDGKTDDTKAIQAAINAAPASNVTTIYFPKGTYILASVTTTPNYLENYFLLVHSKLLIKGDGDNSIIKLADHLFDKPDTNANAHFFYGVYVNNINIESLSIDMNGSNNLVPENTTKNHSSIFIKHGNGVRIKNTTIKNCASHNMVIIIGTGKNVLIENCNFINGGYYVGTPQANRYQTDFSFVYCEWDSSVVKNNHIEQQNIDIALNCFSGGVELHGSYCYAAANNIIGCNPGIYVSSSWHPMESTIVENNKFDNCLRGISFWVSYPMNNIIIQNNQISLTHSRKVKHYILCGIETPNGNTSVFDSKHANGAVISHLRITGNTISSLINDTARDRTAGMVLHSIENSTIKNNTIKGMNFGGLVLQGSKWGMDSVLIAGNSFVDIKKNIDTITPAAYINITDHYSSIDKNTRGIKGIFVTNNGGSKTDNSTDKMVSQKVRQGDFINVFIAGPQKMEEAIQLRNNNFSNKKEDIRFVKLN